MATTVPTTSAPAPHPAGRAQVDVAAGFVATGERARAAASVAPSVVFLVANALVGVRAAIIATTISSLLVVARRRRRGRAVGLFLPLSVLYVVCRGAVGILSGSDDLYFGSGLAASALVALAVLVTTMTSSPAAAAVIPLFVRYSPETVAHPAYRRVARQVTAVWALGELAVTGWELHHLVSTTAAEFLGLRMLVGWPAMSLLIAMLIFYVRLRLDPVEMSQPREAGAGAAVVRTAGRPAVDSSSR